MPCPVYPSLKIRTRHEAISQLVKMLNLTLLAPQAVPLRGERDTTNPPCPCPSPFGEGRLSAAKRGEVRQSADSEMTSCLVLISRAGYRGQGMSVLKKVRFRPHPRPLPEFREGSQRRLPSRTRLRRDAIHCVRWRVERLYESFLNTLEPLPYA